MSKPDQPCPVCGSPVFWADRSGKYRCAKHQPADVPGAVVKFYMPESVTKDRVVMKAIEDLDSDEQPTKPCMLDGSTIFWRSNGSGLWSCAQHNMPWDESDVAEVMSVGKSIAAGRRSGSLLAPHPSVVAARSMTVPSTSYKRNGRTATGRGIAGRQQKKDDHESIRDMHGRRRERE